MSGDAIESKDVIAYFQSILQIDAALLLIDHTSKSTEGDKTVFGSTYKNDLSPERLGDARRPTPMREAIPFPSGCFTGRVTARSSSPSAWT